jgi:hypothetical protein
MFNKVLSIPEKERAQNTNENWENGKDLVEIIKRNVENMNK